MSDVIEAVKAPVEKEPLSVVVAPYDKLVPYTKPRTVAFAPPVAVMVPLPVPVVAVIPEIACVVIVGAMAIVIERFPESAETFPAVSVCRALMVCAPCESADEVIVTVLEAQVPVPNTVELSFRETVAPLSQEMVKPGVVLEVMLSVEDEPLSVAVVMSGVPGADGTVVSTIKVVTESVLDALPAVSVTIIVQFE